MQTSLIQEPSGTAHSKTTRSSQHKNENRTEDSFRDRFNAELYNKDGVVNKSPDKISKELEEAEWLRFTVTTYQGYIRIDEHRL